MSVCPCAKVMCTKDNRVRFFCSKGVYWESKLRFDSNAQSLTKLEPNEIFNDFAIFREPFDESESNFFYFKGMEKKIT